MSPRDLWADGDAYESYIGRWSRSVGAAFVDWLSTGRRKRWLDIGCGTGALSATILAHAEPLSVVGIDPSSDFVEHARAHVVDPRATFAVGSAAAIPLPVGAADAVVSGLVLNFVPDVPAALAEMGRVAALGSTVAAYVWDYAGRMDLIRRFWDAALALDPAAAAEDEGVRFPLCAPGLLAAAFTGAGLTEVETRAIDVATPFASFEELWAPFLSGVGPAPGYAMRLDHNRRNALRDRLRATLPVEPDGSIQLIARAWAVRGEVGPGTSAGSGLSRTISRS